MIFHNSIQSYSRPKTGLFGVRQHLSRRTKTELPGGLLLWIAMGRILAVTGLVLVVFYAVSGWYLRSLEASAAVAQQEKQKLVDSNISLRAERAGMIAPRRIEISASSSLALQVPVAGQVIKFNRNPRQFAKF